MFSLVFPLGAKFHLNAKKNLKKFTKFLYLKKSLNFEKKNSQNFSEIIQNSSIKFIFSICLFVFLKMSLSFTKKNISAKFHIFLKFGIFMLKIQCFFGEKNLPIFEFFPDFF